jgi:hypothetical protein
MTTSTTARACSDAGIVDHDIEPAERIEVRAVHRQPFPGTVAMKIKVAQRPGMT